MNLWKRDSSSTSGGGLRSFRYLPIPTKALDRKPLVSPGTYRLAMNATTPSFQTVDMPLDKSNNHPSFQTVDTPLGKFNNDSDRTMNLT